MPPPSPTQAAQEFETKLKCNAIGMWITCQTSPNFHKRPASVKKRV
jgi:G:T/U-mismatch repair DNA glycosylase